MAYDLTNIKTGVTLENQSVADAEALLQLDSCDIDAAIEAEGVCATDEWIAVPHGASGPGDLARDFTVVSPDYNGPGALEGASVEDEANAAACLETPVEQLREQVARRGFALNKGRYAYPNWDYVNAERYTEPTPYSL